MKHRNCVKTYQQLSNEYELWCRPTSLLIVSSTIFGPTPLPYHVTNSSHMSLADWQLSCLRQIVLFLLRGVFWTLRFLRCMRKTGNWA